MPILVDGFGVPGDGQHSRAEWGQLPDRRFSQTEHFDAERARPQNLCASQLVQLQESSVHVPGDCVVGLGGLDQVEQIAV